jgi:DNA polymerase-3 subunit epsilon
MQMSEGSNFWADHLDRAEQIVWPERVLVEFDAKRRGDSMPGESAPEPQQRTVQANDRFSGSHPQVPSASVSDVLKALGAQAPTASATAEYARLLDTSLDDRLLTSEEVDRLVNTARSLGLDSATLGSLHRGQFDEVVRAAWHDGVLTEAERADIVRVAELLGIDRDSVAVALREAGDVEALLGTREHAEVAAAIPNPVLHPKATVVLTGEMTRDRAHIEAEILALGYGVGGAVTKKTALLIVADQYTQSGKAKKARQYGIPVLEEHEGLALLRGGGAAVEL